VIATNHFDQSDAFTAFQFYADLVCTGMFAFEIIWKIIAYTPRQYFRSTWQQLDVLIVFSFILGMIFQYSHSFLKILLLVRLIRLFRLFRVTSELRTLIKALLLALPSTINLGLTVVVVIHIYAVAGIWLFHDIPRRGFFQYEHYCFQNWPDSFIFLFGMMTGNFWDEAMAATIRNSTEYAVVGTIYYISYVLLTEFLIVNLFVGAIWNNFTFLFGLKDLHNFSLNDIDRLLVIWSKFDPFATYFISLDQCKLLVQLLPTPLGLGKTSDVRVVDNFIERLDIPITNDGSIFFPDLLLSLVSNVYPIPLTEKELYFSVYQEWRKAWPLPRSTIHTNWSIHEDL